LGIRSVERLRCSSSMTLDDHQDSHLSSCFTKGSAIQASSYLWTVLYFRLIDSHNSNSCFPFERYFSHQSNRALVLPNQDAHHVWPDEADRKVRHCSREMLRRGMFIGLATSSLIMSSQQRCPVLMLAAFFRYRRPRMANVY
jgi:hypothetical protein